MMGLAFEVHDSVRMNRKPPEHKDGKEDAERDLERQFKSIQNPSAKDIFHYAFCHAGILTGIHKSKETRPFVFYIY